LFLKPVRTSKNPKEMLRYDLENENETIRNYRDRIRQCETLGEYAKTHAGLDFIQHYIFPGGMMPTREIIRREAARAGLRLLAHKSKRSMSACSRCHLKPVEHTRRWVSAFDHQ
jgi:hypothetical protein